MMILGNGCCSTYNLNPQLVIFFHPERVLLAMTNMRFNNCKTEQYLIQMIRRQEMLPERHQDSRIRSGGSLNNDPLWWHDGLYQKKWVTIPAQTVNSPQYKQLREWIHMPYRKIDHNQTKCFYFPTYVIFKIKNITEFDFDSLSANINGVLIVHMRVDYKNHVTLKEQDYQQVKVRKALEKLFRVKNLDVKEVTQQDMMKSKTFNQSFIMAQEQDKKKKKKEEEEEDDDQDAGLKKFLYIQFNRDNPLRLPSKRVFEGQIKLDSPSFSKQEGTILKWTIRKEFTIALSPGTGWEDLIAPFNLLNFKLTLSFQDIDIQLPSSNDLNFKKSRMMSSSKQIHQNKEDPDNYREMVKFKFNCMKRVGNNTTQEQKRIFEQLMFTDDGSLGQYDLAETGLNVQCQKYLSKVYAEDDSSRYRSYKVITFTIPFYKYPIMDALTIFIPLVLITILTLFTFVQGPDFNDKIGNIATLMIVYVGLMPVINDSLPPTTKVTLIDIVLYCQLLISVLCLIRGFQIKEYTPVQFDEYRVWDDSVFLFCVVVAIITALTLISLLVYYCVQKSYYYNLQEGDIDVSDKKLSHWVSPHLHPDARSLKTETEKMQQQKIVKAQQQKKAKAERNQKNQQGLKTGKMIQVQREQE